MFDIDFNAADFAREIEQFGARNDAAFKAALGAAALSMHASSVNALTSLIYQKDIPKVRRKRGVNAGQTVLAWRRKMRNGGLLGAETYAQSSDGWSYSVFTDPGSPAAKYAKARHNLNSPSRIDKKTRVARWREQAVRTGKPRAIEKFRAEYQRQIAR